MPKAKYFVYIIECADGTLYTGITTDVTRRVAEHNGPLKAARYTRARQPVVLRHMERCKDRSAASKREAAIKRLARAEKQKLFT